MDLHRKHQKVAMVVIALLVGLAFGFLLCLVGQVSRLSPTQSMASTEVSFLGL